MSANSPSNSRLQAFLETGAADLEATLEASTRLDAKLAAIYAAAAKTQSEPSSLTWLVRTGDESLREALTASTDVEHRLTDTLRRAATREPTPTLPSWTADGQQSPSASTTGQTGWTTPRNGKGVLHDVLLAGRTHMSNLVLAPVKRWMRSSVGKLSVRRGRRPWVWHRDQLTGLPDRQWLQERIQTALDDASQTGALAALVLMDLDRFRSVNDTLGHIAGDRLLQQIADRVRDALPHGAQAARLGGDEFALLLPDVRSTAAATRVASTLSRALSSPLDLDGLTLVLEASAGVAVFPDHAVDAEGLLRRAEQAMYRAKRDRTGIEVYEPEQESSPPERLGLLGDLQQALGAHEVQLHYQPTVRFDGQITSLEAVVRWVHPERGTVPPDEFIAIAESSGLMPHLNEYVLETAIRQAAQWQAQGLYVPVAVSVSPRHFHTPGFAEAVIHRLARHGVPGEALQLEITEHVIQASPQLAGSTLAELSRQGVHIALDDFGTGFSSLVHLRRLPLRELKIDRSLVAQLAVDAQDAGVVRCTIDLAHSLGLLVVAEGVDDNETSTLLRTLDCDAMQGWLVAAPMPPEEMTAWLGTAARNRPQGQAAAATPWSSPQR